MPEYLAWVVVVINIIVMLLGFATMRREQHRDASKQLEAAIANEHRLTAIESSVRQIMHKLGMSDRATF